MRNKIMVRANGKITRLAISPSTPERTVGRYCHLDPNNAIVGESMGLYSFIYNKHSNSETN